MPSPNDPATSSPPAAGSAPGASAAAAASVPPPLSALPGLESPASAAPKADPGREAAAQRPEPSTAPPPLLDGIIRVKVPADKIQPFLVKTALCKGCDKAVIARAAGVLQGLECAEGSEIITAGKLADGLFILFSGKAAVLLPGAGGELLTLEELVPGARN